MKRIIIHWTAGTHEVSEIDKEHYHFIVSGKGTVVKGDHDIGDNLSTADGDYAAHTLGCNKDSIGVSMAGMAGATEIPFSAGKWPITEAQVNVLAGLVADLARQYKIPVTPQNILTHAEVEPVLGIRQRGKWDVTRIPFKPDLKGPQACGNWLRELVAAKLK